MPLRVFSPLSPASNGLGKSAGPAGRSQRHAGRNGITGMLA
jgi:hypothetical protein